MQKGETVTTPEGQIYTPDMVLGESRKGLKVTYTTDTRPVEAIANHAADSDLFICEGMYGEPGKEKKAREYKHMTFREAAGLAAKADPGELWLTHYSPSLVRPEEYIEEARRIFPRTVAGRDGKTAELRFEDDD